MAGSVIVLNGTSSAGKSSIAVAFQKLRAQAGECWVIVGIDDFLPRLPSRWVDLPGAHGSLAADGARLVRDGDRANFEVGALGRSLLHAYRRSVRELALAGLNVLVDEVVIEDDGWLDWCAALEGLSTTWVAVRCDVEVATERERTRGDRSVGLARGQADFVHRDPSYDIELDATTTPVGELAASLDRAYPRANLASSG